jgi:hypothetical protein
MSIERKKFGTHQCDQNQQTLSKPLSVSLLWRVILCQFYHSIYKISHQHWLHCSDTIQLRLLLFLFLLLVLFNCKKGYNYRFNNSERGNGSSVFQCSTTVQCCFIFSSAIFGIFVVMNTVGLEACVVVVVVVVTLR